MQRRPWLLQTLGEMLHFAMFFAVIVGLLLLLSFVLAHV